MRTSTSKSSDSHGLSVVQEALVALLPYARKFQSRLTSGMDSGDSGWYRFSVKLNKGQVEVVQIGLDEHCNGQDLMNGRAKTYPKTY